MSRQRGFTARVLWDSNLHDLATYIAAAVVIRNNCFVLQALWLRQQSRAAPDFTALQAMPPKGMLQPPPPPPLPPINADALRDQIVALAVEEIDWEQVQAAAAAGPRPMPQKRTEVEKKEAKAAKRQRQKNAKALGNGVRARHQSAEEESSTVSSQSRPGRWTAQNNVAVPSSSAAAASGSGQVSYTGVAVPSSSAAAASVPRDSRPVPPGALERVRAAMQVVSDSDSVDYGSNSEDIPDKPKNQLHCMHAGGEDGCGAYNLLWSQFMLVLPTEGEADASWSGKLWGTCQKCSGLEPRTFKREARRRQEIRAKTLRGHRIRSKTMTFKTMRAHIKAKFKGGTNAQIRELTMQRMKVAAGAFALAFEKATRLQKEAHAKIVEDWLATVERCANDPSFAASTDARTMSAEEASYFAKIADGICFSYLCRKKDCMFFGANNAQTWIKSKSKYQFRCPMCGYQHLPFATHGDDVPAKRILTVVDPLTGEMLHIPSENPASDDERFLNNQIELTARDIQTQEDFHQWWSRAYGDVKAWLAREGACRAWMKMPYNPAKHAAPVHRGAWDDSEQLKNGFVMRLRLTDVQAARQPFSDFNGLISVFANFVAASKVLASRM